MENSHPQQAEQLVRSNGTDGFVLLTWCLYLENAIAKQLGKMDAKHKLAYNLIKYITKSLFGNSLWAEWLYKWDKFIENTNIFLRYGGKFTKKIFHMTNIRLSIDRSLWRTLTGSCTWQSSALPQFECSIWAEWVRIENDGLNSLNQGNHTLLELLPVIKTM